MEAERPCPICNGSGRAQHRGFTTPCHHCAATRMATLETQLALARKALAAAEEMRVAGVWEETPVSRYLTEEAKAFDAAMAEAAKEENGE